MVQQESTHVKSQHDGDASSLEKRELQDTIQALREQLEVFQRDKEAALRESTLKDAHETTQMRATIERLRQLLEETGSLFGKRVQAEKVRCDKLFLPQPEYQTR